MVSVVAIDKDIPLADAALFGCAVITGAGAVLNTAGVEPGATLAVVGLGGVGLNALMAGAAAGAERIVAIDTNEARFALARELGATDTFSAADPACAGRVLEAAGGVDYAFEMAGSADAMMLAYAVTRRGGTVVSAGLPGPGTEFRIEHANLVGGERTIKGSYMGSCDAPRDIPRFLDLYRRGKLPVQKLRSGEIGFADLNAAFDRLADGGAVRQMLRCG